jgi:NADPH-dependent 2,4-dienoyl-CoA reductase/sulfur reductase-like enzyme
MQASAFRTDARGQVVEVTLASGEILATDLLVIGIGIAANDDIARECGLEVADGIVVDEYCRTADPRIYAVGDCTRHPCYEWGGFAPAGIDLERIRAGQGGRFGDPRTTNRLHEQTVALVDPVPDDSAYRRTAPRYRPDGWSARIPTRSRPSTWPTQRFRSLHLSTE